MKVALLALLLSGCAVFDSPPYDWFDSGKPKLDRVVWEQHSKHHVNAACGPFKTPLNNKTLFAGCVVRLNNSGNPYCLVQSTLSAEQAQHVYDSSGMSHRQHEEEYHCRKALNHH